MTAASFEIRQCPNCGLRYPLTADHPFGERCPSCLGETQVVLKHTIASLPHGGGGTGAKGNFSVLLDNIRSIWNVGSIFRTSDGLGIHKLYLCGITPTPENKTIRKTSLGAEKNVAWNYSHNALDTAKKLRGEGYMLLALEQDPRAIPISRLPIPDSRTPILILGNEVTGVDPELLDLSDYIVQIPMHGQKQSFNVEVAFAIAAYALRSRVSIRM